MAPDCEPASSAVLRYRRRIHGICTVFVILAVGVTWAMSASAYADSFNAWWSLPFIVLMLGSGLLGEILGNLLTADLARPEDFGPPPV